VRDCRSKRKEKVKDKDKGKGKDESNRVEEEVTFVRLKIKHIILIHMMHVM
jgi:hypothetical protein